MLLEATVKLSKAVQVGVMRSWTSLHFISSVESIVQVLGVYYIARYLLLLLLLLLLLFINAAGCSCD